MQQCGGCFFYWAVKRGRAYVYLIAAFCACLPRLAAGDMPIGPGVFLSVIIGSGNALL